MPTLIFGIAISALLSITSLMVVLTRVSPILSPVYAVPAFLVSLLLAVGSTATLALWFLWSRVPVHFWDTGKIITVSLRQGVLFSLCTVILFGLDVLQLFSWGAALLTVAVFSLIEVAMNA